MVGFLHSVQVILNESSRVVRHGVCVRGGGVMGEVRDGADEGSGRYDEFASLAGTRG